VIVPPGKSANGSMGNVQPPAPPPILEQAQQDVAALAASGRWARSDDQELERQFVRATNAALRAPRIAERSMMLRRIARVTVPRRIRPHLRHGLERVERAVGEWRDRSARK